MGKNMVVVAAFVCMAGVAMHHFVEIPKSLDLRPAKPHDHLTMKAVAYAKHGNTSVLEFDPNYPRPQIKDNQVLIKVMASSLNPCDFKCRRNSVPGFIFPLPKIPGEDVAGVIVEMGDQTTKFKIGDRVAALMPLLGARWGSAAEYAAVEESLVAHIGEETSFEQAAALPLVSLTVLQAFSKLQKKPEKPKILIHAGAGGVGTFAIQYAKKVLDTYVATTASTEKKEILQRLGADLVIDYRTNKFEDLVQGYDAVVDTMSWAYESRTLGKNSKVLKPTGHYLNILSSDWSFEKGEVTNGFLTVKNKFLHMVYNLISPGSVPLYDTVTVEPNGKQLQYVMDLVEKGIIQAVIDRKFKLSDATAAYDYLEQGHSTGKVILDHAD